LTLAATGFHGFFSLWRICLGLISLDVWHLDLEMIGCRAAVVLIHFCITRIDAFFTNAESVGTG
jgi:hypothetical protein